MRRLINRRTTVAAVLAAAGLLAAACGSSGGTGSTTGGGGGTSNGALTISDEGGTTWVCGFNPFNSNDEAHIFGPVYEPLLFVNNLAKAPLAHPAPWLATKYAFTNAGKKLTFWLRKGVTFSNGDPFTSADVTFTFNMIHKNAAMDLSGVWPGGLQSVAAEGPSKVVMTFKKASPLLLYNIADQVAIVDQKIYSKVANPATFPDLHPVGTGAYELHSCSGANFEYTANPHYYKPGVPAVKTVNYPSYTSNTPANEALANGSDQWGSQYIPNIQTAYLSKNPAFHSFSPAIASVSLLINLAAKSPLQDVKVRQAMAFAIDRNAAAQTGEGGQEPPANQTDIVTGRGAPYAIWYDGAQAAQPPFGNNYAFNIKTAKQILTSDGYKMVNGVMTKNGQQLSFSIVNNSGFSDWITTINDVIAPDLKQAGIAVTDKTLSQNAYQSALFTGHFQLGYYAQPGGPGPFYEMRQWLFSGNTAPIGKIAPTNFERYSNPKTDALIHQFEQTPLSNVPVQRSIVNKLQLVMLKDVPIIPVTGEVDWYQYDTAAFTGWPTKANMFAQPAQYQFPDWGWVLMHLHPVK